MLGDTSVDPRPLNAHTAVEKKKPSKEADIVPVSLKSFDTRSTRNIYTISIYGFPLERSTALLLPEEKHR